MNYGALKDPNSFGVGAHLEKERMAKKMSTGGLISPTSLWGKPLPTTAQPANHTPNEKVTGKMTDSDDVMDDDEIDVDAELANADVDDDELVAMEAEDDVEVTGELESDDDGDDEEDAEEAEDEEPEYDDDITDEDQDVVEDEEEEVVAAVADDEEEVGDSEVSENNEDVAAMAEKMSLSDHIRAEISRRQKAGEEMRGKDIVASLAKRKITVSPAQVSQLLKKAGLSGKPRGRKPAAAAATPETGGEKSRTALKAKKRDAAPAAPAPTQPRQALKARPASENGFKVPMDQLQAAAAFVDACGGSFKSAERILTAAAQLSQTFGN